MKGTISPELKMIMANPDYRKAFIDGFFNGLSRIDLGDGTIVHIRRYGDSRKEVNPTSPKRRKRNLLQILLGK